MLLHHNLAIHAHTHQQLAALPAACCRKKKAKNEVSIEFQVASVRTENVNDYRPKTQFCHDQRWIDKVIDRTMDSSRTDTVIWLESKSYGTDIGQSFWSKNEKDTICDIKKQNT